MPPLINEIPGGRHTNSRERTAAMASLPNRRALERVVARRHGQSRSAANKAAKGRNRSFIKQEDELAKELRVSVTMAVPDELFAQASVLAKIKPGVEALQSALNEAHPDGGAIVSYELVTPRATRGAPLTPRDGGV